MNDDVRALKDFLENRNTRKSTPSWIQTGDFVEKFPDLST